MKYNSRFYKAMNIDGSDVCSNFSSAKKIIPYILELFPNISSVVDFGCGTGTWLKACIDNGIENVCGLDGAWVDKSQMLIPEEKFVEIDLTSDILNDDYKYDLAISLEVAEHLDEKYADQFIENLCKTSNLIMFSAAIPNQGGTGHVNEQWQSYWVAKFKKRGFLPFDLIRGKFEDDKNVMPCYKQNILIYVKSDSIEQYPILKKYKDIPFITDIVLPYLVLGNEKKSGKFLVRQSKLYIAALIRRILKIKEYGLN